MGPAGVGIALPVGRLGTGMHQRRVGPLALVAIEETMEILLVGLAGHTVATG